jgi:membrane-associated phospholipid phosphatase
MPMQIEPIPRWVTVLTVLMLICALYLDGAITSRMPADGTTFGDFHHLLRALGYLPTWLFIGLLLILSGKSGHHRARRSAALAIVSTATLSGLSAEILKVIVRRPDPGIGPLGSWTPVMLEGGWWNPEWWNGADLCFPSGHAAVAWGAAIAISRRWLGTAPVMLLLAAGCAAGRVETRGHYVSDVIASLLVALIVSFLVEKRIRRFPENAPRGAQDSDLHPDTAA